MIHGLDIPLIEGLVDLIADFQNGVARFGAVISQFVANFVVDALAHIFEAIVYSHSDSPADFLILVFELRFASEDHPILILKYDFIEQLVLDVKSVHDLVVDAIEESGGIDAVCCLLCDYIQLFADQLIGQSVTNSLKNGFFIFMLFGPQTLVLILLAFCG